MALLTAYEITTGQGAIIDVPHPTDAELDGNDRLKIEATVSTGYLDRTSARNFATHGISIGIGYNEMRNELIGLNAMWGTMSTDDKKAMVEHYVYPTGISTTDLDAIYPQIQRDGFKKDTMASLNSDEMNIFSIWKDISNGKHYKATTDGGVTVKTEITTDNVL